MAPTGSQGSVSYMFKRMGVIRLSPEGINTDELELELIDHGLAELGDAVSDEGEAQLILRCAFSDFGTLQQGIEARGITPISSELEYIPTTTVELAEDQATEVLKLVDRLEQDDDVQRVFHNLA